MALSPELDAVEEAYRAGIARLGVAVAYLTLKNWDTVSSAAPEATGAAWTDRTLRLILAVRWQSQRLATAYYQMARAVETGTTLGLPEYTSDAAGVTLDGLRAHFVNILREVGELGAGDMKTDNPDYNWLASELLAADIGGGDLNARSIRFADTDIASYIQALLSTAKDDRLVKVDQFNWPRHMTLAEVEKAFKALLTKESVAVQAAKAKMVLADKEMDELLAQKMLDKQHADSGSRGAGWADWASVDAARTLVDYAYNADFRVKAYARKTGPNPCAFCSMLSSRGFVYRTEGSAGANTKYHPNCHCTVVVRWSNDDDLPPLSQFYKDNWNEVTDHASGTNNKLNAWRKWLVRRGPNTTPTTSQED